MRIAFLLYPTTHVKIDEDSSFWIMAELAKRGHEVYYFESRHLVWQKNAPFAYLAKALLNKKKGYLPSPYSKNLSDLSAFSCIFIRKEPPFTTQYLYALQHLSAIKHKVFILNDPDGIALSNEKLFSLLFPKITPESMVSEDAHTLRSFILEIGSPVVLKPLHDKGGAGIFMTHAKDKNLPSLLQTATQGGKERIIVQRYIKANSVGDKRILLLNGEVLGAFIRRPPNHDFRANLSIGSTMHRSSLTKNDKKIVELIKPTLLERGLYFVGIDVIGEYLTEVNVTSPAGIPEINHFNGTKLEEKVVDFIEATVISGRKRF